APCPCTSAARPHARRRGVRPHRRGHRERAGEAASVGLRPVDRDLADAHPGLPAPARGGERRLGERHHEGGGGRQRRAHHHHRHLPAPAAVAHHQRHDLRRPRRAGHLPGKLHQRRRHQRPAAAHRDWLLQGCDDAAAGTL
ncbi:MAG: hypothetical protein AVDCRST_MAG68-451, partial [uncultured Gemmatimonadetes bacterium]